MLVFFFLQEEAGIRYSSVTGVQRCALPISIKPPASPSSKSRSDDTPPLPAIPAPSHKTPPSHLRSAPPQRCISPPLQQLLAQPAPLIDLQQINRNVLRRPNRQFVQR